MSAFTGWWKGRGAKRRRLSKAAKVAHTLFFVLLMFLDYSLARYWLLRIKTEEYVDLAASEMAERHFSVGDTALYQLVEMGDSGPKRFPRNGWPTNSLTLSMRLLGSDGKEFDAEFVREYNKSMQDLIQSGHKPHQTIVTGTN